jgi:hypothetical protein
MHLEAVARLDTLEALTVEVTALDQERGIRF